MYIDAGSAVEVERTWWLFERECENCSGSEAKERQSKKESNESFLERYSASSPLIRFRYRYRTISFINRALVWFAMISHVFKSFSFLISFGPTIKQHPSTKTKACKLREDLTEVCGLSDFHMAKCQKNRFSYKVLICRIHQISKNIIKTR